MAKQKFTAIPELTAQEIVRLRGHIDKRGPDECWPWITVKPNRYARFRIRDKTYQVTRIIHFLKTGVDLGTLRICHTCDNPPCCNDSHHFPGTQADNVHDAAAKGRMGVAKGARSGAVLHPEVRPRGERHTSAKLTEQLVREIRSRHRAGVSASRMGREYGVTKQSILAIIWRHSWAHVLED